MNSVFNALNGNMMEQVNTLRRNPMQFFLQHRMNVPREYMNDPEGAVRYMVNSGQISQQRVEEAKNYARMLGINI